MPQTFTDADIAKWDSAPAPLSDSDIAAHDAGLSTTLLGKLGGASKSVATGAAKGAASTIFNAGDLIRRGEMGIAKSLGVDTDKIPPAVRDFFGLDRVIDKPEVQAGITPQGTAEKIGFGGEKAAEFMAPASIAGKITSGAGLATRATGQAIASGLTRGAQTGGNTNEMAGAATLGAGGSIGLEAAGKLIQAAKGSGASTADIVGLFSPRAKNWMKVLGLGGSNEPAVAEAASAATKELPAEQEAFYDDISTGMGGKKYSDLNAKGQAHIRDLAQRITDTSGPKPTAGSPTTPAPSSPASPAKTQGSAPVLDGAPVSTSVQQPQATAPSTVPQTQSTTAPQSTPPSELRSSGTSNPPSLNNPNDIAKALQQEMAKNGYSNPPMEPASTEAIPEHEANRADAISKTAAWLHRGGAGITPADAARMSPAQRQLVFQAAGVKSQSPATWTGVLNKLTDLWKQQPVGY